MACIVMAYIALFRGCTVERRLWNRLDMLRALPGTPLSFLRRDFACSGAGNFAAAASGSGLAESAAVHGLEDEDGGCGEDEDGGCGEDEDALCAGSFAAFNNSKTVSTWHFHFGTTMKT